MKPDPDDQLYCATCNEWWPCTEIQENWEGLREIQAEWDAAAEQRREWTVKDQRLPEQESSLRPRDHIPGSQEKVNPQPRRIQHQAPSVFDLECATCGQPWPCSEARSRQPAPGHAAAILKPTRFDLNRPLEPIDPPPFRFLPAIFGALIVLAAAWWLSGCAHAPPQPRYGPISCREVLAYQIEADRRYEAIRHLQLIALHGPDGMGQRASPAEASNRQAWARTLRVARSQAWGEVLRWRSECRV